MFSDHRRKRRGQLAIENMILYVLVLSVVGVGLYAVWTTGILTPTQGKRDFVGFSQLVPESSLGWVMDWEGDQAVIVLKNVADAPLRILKDGVSVDVGATICEPGPQAAVVVDPSQTYTAVLNCEGLGDEYNLGDEYEADVTITYISTVSGRTHESTGKLYGPMELYVDTGIGPQPTVTTIPKCFYHDCNKPGEMDTENCGDILWLQECEYCAKDTNTCWFKGQCEKTCSIDRECEEGFEEIEDPQEREYLRRLNKCDKCLEDPDNPGQYMCQEEDSEDEPGCGPCPEGDWGTLDSTWCDMDECKYCYREWVQQIGQYSFNCEEKESCGDSCLDYGFDIYQECEQTCTHCKPDLSTTNPVDGICDQGDCGRRCGPNAPIEECEVGCAYCNITTRKCEMGDCGKPCSPGQEDECELGCDVCYSIADGSGVCVKTDIGVALNAHNGTEDGAVVTPSETIYLLAEAECTTGVERIIVSESIPFPVDDEIEECTDVAEKINSELGQIEDPQDPAVTQYLMNEWGIQWNPEEHLCGGQETCTNTWETSESQLNRYCYFAMAKKSGGGRWTNVVADYIQVGYIDVFLAYPRAEDRITPE